MSLSEKGMVVLKQIQELTADKKLPIHFTAGMITRLVGEKVSGNTLSSMGKQGYLIREGGSPITYHLAPLEDIEALLNNTGINDNHDTMLTAKKLKRNEFYTQFQDVENEIMHYREYFSNKRVLLNCNDGNWSAFFKFFLLNFDAFNLKELISLEYGEHAKAYIINDDLNNDGFIDENDIQVIQLNGDGSFQSEEGLQYIANTDIIVTNPPFSEFRTFLNILIDSGKQFLIVGNNNALSYQEVFKAIKENKVWLGYNTNKTMNFYLPKNYQELGYEAKGEDNGNPYGTVAAISWFTNLPNKKRTEELILINSYNPINYPHYDGHDDIIEVDRVIHIPKDYDGYMGVPITYLNVYCPKQFELCALMASTTVTDTNWGYPYINGKKKYARVIIKRK